MLPNSQCALITLRPRDLNCPRLQGEDSLAILAPDLPSAISFLMMEGPPFLVGISEQFIDGQL